MISDATVDRFYYIFDSREHRALVVDRTTGEEYVRNRVPRSQLIARVRACRSSATVRQFARWCARQVNAEGASAHTPAGRLWSAARREDESTWRRVRRETTNAVALAVAVGLPRGRPDAARLLVLQACTNPDAEQAALDAAHMSERWAEFRTESEPAAAAQSMRARHIDWLLDALPRS